MSTKNNRGCNRFRTVLLMVVLVLLTSGCYAPLRSRAVPAHDLPEEFRTPWRTMGPELNLANLTQAPPDDYLLSSGDVLNVTVPGLFVGAEVLPLQMTVMANGEINLPLITRIQVGGLNLLQAQRAISHAYENGFFANPRVSVALLERSTTTVLVLGQVRNPGMHALANYENDVGHALAAAGGMTDEADNMVEVHRRGSVASNGIERLPMTSSWGNDPGFVDTSSGTIQQIPLRGPGVESLRPEDVILHPGDVVVVPNRKNKVFYVVGRLSQTNTVRFTIGNRERELGVGFILPREREIDVVTAVVMAGYIDPIDSPTTVTLHRVMPDGRPMLIHVDLIKARYDGRETVLVQAGDIIYLNPDSSWWFRRTLDKVIGDLITLPYTNAVRF